MSKSPLSLSQAKELVLTLERARVLSGLLYSEIMGISGFVELQYGVKDLIHSSEEGDNILEGVEFGSGLRLSLNFFEDHLNKSMDQIRENVSDWMDAEKARNQRRNLGPAPDPQDFKTTKEWEEAAQAYDEKVQRIQHVLNDAAAPKSFGDFRPDETDATLLAHGLVHKLGGEDAVEQDRAEGR